MGGAAAGGAIAAAGAATLSVPMSASGFATGDEIAIVDVQGDPNAAGQYELARVDEAREGTLIQVVDIATTPERAGWAFVEATGPAEHVEALRGYGFSDVAIHDIVQVTALFNYYNRIADGLGIDDEPEWT